MQLVHEGFYYLGVATTGVIGGAILSALSPIGLLGCAIFAVGLGMELCQKDK